MNNIALFLAQLSAGQAAPGQNGLGNAGEAGPQNFEFWSAVIGNIKQQGTETTDLNIGEQDGGETLGAFPFLKSADNDLDKLVELAQKIGDQITIKIQNLEGISEDADQSVTFDQLNRTLDLLRQQLKLVQEAGTDQDSIPVAALLLSGYSPAEITEIQQNIEELETKLDRPVTLEDLIAGVGSLLSEEERESADVSDILPETCLIEECKSDGAEADTITALQSGTQEVVLDETNENSKGPGEQVPAFVAKIIRSIQEHKTATADAPGHQKLGEIIQAIIKTEKNKASEIEGTENPLETKTTEEIVELLAEAGIKIDDPENEDAIAAALNSLIVGEEFPVAFDSEASEPKTQSVRDILAGRAAKIAGQSGNDNAATNAAASKNNQAPVTNPQNINAAATQGEIPLPATFASFDDALFFTNSDGSSFSIHSGLPFSNTAQAAHMITQSTQQAGQPHPATELVSARLQQAGQAGQSQTMTLHLDPAELGRMEIELVFSHEKTVKAKMLIEKPETYLMMQRDSAVLERALQNSGLEIDGGGINFELAEDGSAFEQNNNGQGGGEKFGGSGSGGEEISDDAIIESTMTWSVDQETGHTRYSILA